MYHNHTMSRLIALPISPLDPDKRMFLQVCKCGAIRDSPNSPWSTTEETSMLPARLRQARLEAGMSQADVAEEINTYPSHISQWENGRHVPSLNKFRHLCRLYKKSADWLLALDEPTI